MDKGTHFLGQPMYGQLLNLLDKSKILRFSRENGGERYVKRFDAWQHLVIMLYAVIKRFDSLREITNSMFPEARKLAHLGISLMPRRSTLADANARRSERIFEAAYRDLYSTYKEELSSDSRKGQVPKWLSRLQILDSTTITLFSNLIFKGVGRHPKTGRKKVKGGEDIEHHARIITYVDTRKKKARLVSLLTNDMEMEVEDIIEIYRQRWEIELLFKQLKQNFPLRYFYGESANAIKIQVWVTLIANLLIMVMQKRIKRNWSFSGLATMFRIMLMYYVNCYTFFEEPEKDWARILECHRKEPPEPSLFE